MAAETNSTIPSAQFRITSDDGLCVACARWDSRGPTRGVIQIAHGMGEHLRRYVDTINVLTSMGLTVYGNDHRGHGITARSAAQFGDFGAGGFDLLVSDMVRLTGVARDDFPDVPLFLLGHSMGSFAAQSFVIDHSHEIDGLILSGSGSLDGLARLANAAPAGTNLLNAAFEPARTPFDWLSRNEQVVDAFINDPLCFATLQPQSLASFLGAARSLKDPIALARIRSDLPVYLFSGSEDPVGQHLAGVRLLKERYRAAGLRDIAFDFYPGGRHEMLNETNRRDVQTRLLGWITGVLDRLDVNKSQPSLAHELQR
ncbi:alpha/beta fold hydrolase [Bradyrhizobium sp. Arg816]|uniref:alpha/beta fold hydrolase n=1 Tax=Bradyrhizobium sp. Arg816 TaxID=2998491 RepID=UPI00249E08B8|nr:alpha/beta hydrolase [Bradyrhizobium sp. Arg816]MDI3561894.1 alpha/beta hydrolase [Bradyrhizobium sp. Arg816]